MEKENPFLALLAIEGSTDKGLSKELIENVFLFTLRKTSSKGKILLSLANIIVQDTDNKDVMSEELLSHALFERLMLTDTKKYVVFDKKVENAGNEKVLDDVLNTQAITYLYRAFVACASEQTKHPADCIKVRSLILMNVGTCMRQPELFQGQSFPQQWLQLFQNSGTGDNQLLQEFLVQTVLSLRIDDDIDTLGVLKSIFYPMFIDIQKQLLNANIITLKKHLLWTLNYFVRDKRVPQLGEVLIDYTTPNPNASGNAYGETLFGQLLSISILPKYSNGPYEFFSEITLESQHTDPSLWQFVARIQGDVFSIIRQLLLQSSVTKTKTLHWMATCLAANTARGQLWNNMQLNIQPLATQTASDSFLLGLTAVLLRLCAPLCQPQMKVLIVDPTYCAVSDEERVQKQVAMLKANEETCLLPLSEGEGAKRFTAEKYNFVTELFYLTHKALELGYIVCIEKYTRMTRELHNLQNTYRDSAQSDPNGDMTQNLMRMLKIQMQQFLCLRNCMMEPEFDTFLLKFLEATSIWLTEIALLSSEEYDVAFQRRDFAPHKLRQMTLPAQVTYIPPYLSSVPEITIDNIVAYLSFSRYFPPGQFIEIYPQSHDAFFRMIILFMGSAELVKNPHLRAKLAEALEFLLPKEIAGSMRQAFMTHIFDSHPDRLKVVHSLLNVFVSIEMTGQSVQFEQKFKYRRPMYVIMEFLWTKPEQVQCFRDLAQEAEMNMEAIEPPLFLRFINLLINDAIFLLDESLSNLQQIRQLQEAQVNGNWDTLSANERQQQLTNLQHLGMLTRIDNILGRDTINNLKLLTTEIKSIFCHNSIVDRIAAMLNYFLLNLVGPQKDKFKVKDKKEFEFDPAQTVLEICHIYINLRNSDGFCLAVSQDGRSYSSQLFEYAENILIRIGGGQLIGEMSEFAATVKELENKFKQEQEFIADAPEEFLDPIMSTLMTDPVTLPSSKVTVDRTTIARHLLSDQTDPFNRAPLTMDKVKSNEALKADIVKWIAEKRGASSNS